MGFIGGFSLKVTFLRFEGRVVKDFCYSFMF